MNICRLEPRRLGKKASSTVPSFLGPPTPPCALDAATRLALGSIGAGCQQDGRWTVQDQVSEARAKSLHSCPSPSGQQDSHGTLVSTGPIFPSFYLQRGKAPRKGADN